MVREGLPGGTRVNSSFSQKPGFTAFYFTYRALFLNKKIFLQPAIPIVSQRYDFRCAISKFTPRIDELVEGKQK